MSCPPPLPWSLLLGVSLALHGCSAPGQTMAGKTGDPSSGLGLTQLATAPRVRRVWVEPTASNDYGVLADGHSVAYFDLATHEMRVRDPRTGKERTVATRMPADQDDGSYAENIIGSPDGACLAYEWITSPGKYGLESQLRVACEAPSAAGSVRILDAAESAAALVPLSWAPDGKEIIGRRDVPRTTGGEPAGVRLEAIRSDGGGARVIRATSGSWISGASVSPDGKWLAYDVAEVPGSGNVHLVGMDATGDRVVTPSPGVHRLAGWAGDDGQWLLVLSTAGGSTALWGIPMAPGGPTGEPVLVRSDLWGASRATISASGDVSYNVRAGHLALYSATIGPGQRDFAVGEVHVAHAGSFFVQVPGAWSPVAKEVAYAVSGVASDGTIGRAGIVVRSLSYAAERRIPTPFLVVMRIQWFPDGRSLLVVGTEDRESVIAYRVMVATGAAVRLPELDQLAWPMVSLVVSPVDERVFFATNTLNRFALKEFDLASRTVRVLRNFAPDELLAATAVSRDGRRIALAIDYATPRPGRLVTLAPDGTEREVHRLAPGERFHASTAPFFTPEGDALIFGTYQLASRSTFDINRVTLADGRVTPTGLRRRGLQFVTMSPDGNNLMYSVDGRLSEVWRMDRPIFPAVSAAGRLK